MRMRRFDFEVDMFNFLETPFTDSEAIFVLCIEPSDFNSLQAVERNIICPFRGDNKFSFPNFFDLLTYALSKIYFDDYFSDSEMNDIVLSYMDDLASSLDSITSYNPELDYGNLPDIATVLLLDPSNPFLKAEAAEGEMVMLSQDKLWSANLRIPIFISITAAVFLRSIKALTPSLSLI